MALKPDIPEFDDSVLAGAQRRSSQEATARLAAILVVPLALALAIIVLLFYVFYTGTQVDGESMLPNLRPEDRVLVTKSYEVLKRGDIVVAHLTDPDGSTHDVIKRLVAVPGDTVEVRDDVAIVNGQAEQYSRVIRDPGAGETLPPQFLQPGQVFLLGDNRPISLDSRYIGPVNVSELKGKAIAIYAPIQRVGAVH